MKYTLTEMSGMRWRNEQRISRTSERRSTYICFLNVWLLPCTPPPHMNYLLRMLDVQWVVRNESLTTKPPELIFGAVVGDDGTRDVRFDLAFRA
jgi:hypothetical protein